YYNAAPNARVSLRTIHYLSDKNIREGMNREPDLHEVRYLDNDSRVGKWVEYPWHIHGIPTATVEHSDMIFDNAEHTSKAITATVECFGNHIIQHALKKFKTVD
ncbi:MAG: hypothetical protein K0S25_60, partial [Bacillus sp. (in: firmicutes)]|nr:hypothetical protein [Bacillus sp. (in: firmicutes)]